MGCDWSKLVSENRAKAIGVSWSEQELKAIYELKIPVDYVRGGCLTLEQFKSASSLTHSGKKKPIRYMSKGELQTEARERAIAFSDESTRSDLILLLQEEQGEEALKPNAELALPVDQAVSMESASS